jgi:uncharacterized membrane protein HdeD (DUF308 family)
MCDKLFPGEFLKQKTGSENMSDNRIFTLAYKFETMLWAIGTVLAGVGLLLCPFMLFGLLLEIMPWLMLLIGIWQIFSAWDQKKRRKSYLAKGFAGGVLLIFAILMFCKLEWRDVVLWYCFALLLVISGWHCFMPLRVRAWNRLALWRYLGVFTVWGFACLMLFKPRSGLSDALSLLGVFAAAWGVFQLLLPPPEE